MKRTATTRIYALMLAVLMLLSFAACAKQPAPAETPAVSDTGVTEAAEPAAPETVNVAALKGPTGISMAKLAKDGAESGLYNTTFAGAPDEIVGLITTGEVDVACVPTNLASTLYNKTNGGIRVCAVTTLGVLYLMDASGEINSIADLKGKSIGATGEGSNPEYILNYILEKNGLKPGEDVEITYYAEHSELASLMLSGDVKTAMLPVPFATQVQMKLEGVNAIDLQAEWAKVSETEIAQGVIITTAKYAEEHKDALDRFLADFAASSEYAVNNAAEDAAIIEELGIIPNAALAQKAIPGCNIVYIDGSRMKSLVSDFLSVLYQANPKSVGGALPDDDFYYNA